MLLRTTVLIFILCSAFTFAAAAPGSVTGRVVDQSGGALPGVVVTLTAGGSTRENQTDAAGAYRFDAVAAGPVEIQFRLINFADRAAHGHRRRQVTIVINAVMPLSLSADVIVTGAGHLSQRRRRGRPGGEPGRHRGVGQPGRDHRGAAQRAADDARRAKCSRPCRA